MAVVTVVAAVGVVVGAVVGVTGVDKTEEDQGKFSHYYF